MFVPFPRELYPITIAFISPLAEPLESVPMYILSPIPIRGVVPSFWNEPAAWPIAILSSPSWL